MERIDPKDLLEYPPAEEAQMKLKCLKNKEDRSTVTEFSWDVAIKFFEERTQEGRMGKTDIFYVDGHLIQDENFLISVTVEICREYGFDLLDVLADLILPVGFGYPSLKSGLQGLIDDAFKPVSKIGQQKKILWIEDEHWSNLKDSVVEPVIRQCLLSGVEPFLIAPMKYFDKDVLSTVFKVLNVHQEPDKDCSENSLQTFANLIKFGFLLALRSTIYPVIVLHFGAKMAEQIDAFGLLDLAKADGHTVKYFKNTGPSTSAAREATISNFVATFLFSSSSNKKIRWESTVDTVMHSHND